MLAAAVMALRIAQRGELWLDRTYWLVGLTAASGLAGAVALVLLQRRLLPLRRPAMRLAAGALLFTTFLMLAMMAGFIIYTLGISGQFEAMPDRYYRAVAFATLQTGVLFLISIPPYLLPWPLPGLAAAAVALLMDWRRSKPVEPAPPAV